MPNPLENHQESKSFLATALAIKGSVTPRVLPRVAVTACYAFVVYKISLVVPHAVLPITPFEYSGAILALILVLRVNAGQDRWWEARKIWGGIVNQSRNLALASFAYSHKIDSQLAHTLLKWIAIWPYVMKDSLREQRHLAGTEHLLSSVERASILAAQHMPTYVGFRIATILGELKEKGMGPMAFHRCETERSALIDAIGACERIRNTRIPFVLAVKIRRFILLFIVLLPLALVDRVDLWTPLVVALASYPMYSLDEIGMELQNPFSKQNLSHLPLDGICVTIDNNISAISKDYASHLSDLKDDNLLKEELIKLGHQKVETKQKVT